MIGPPLGRQNIHLPANPFDFFVEPDADSCLFAYPDGPRAELAPCLETIEPRPAFADYLRSTSREGRNAAGLLVEPNTAWQ